jgi:hypothetical protein
MGGSIFSRPIQISRQPGRQQEDIVHAFGKPETLGRHNSTNGS